MQLGMGMGLNVHGASQQKNMRSVILNRVLVMILMVDLVVMVSVASQGLQGSIFDGFYWPNSGWSLFPIPQNPNWSEWVSLPVLVPLSPLDLLVYLVFVGHGVWIFWEIIAVVYIVYPWSPFVQSIVNRTKSAMVTWMRKGQ